MVSKSSFTKVSIIIPAFNEESTIEKILDEVLTSNSLNLAKEIIVIDDNSLDNTIEIAKRVSANHECIKIIAQPKNCGKGAALRQGFSKQLVKLYLFRMQILNTVPKNILNFSHQLLMERPMLCMVQGFGPNKRPAYFIFGTA